MPTGKSQPNTGILEYALKHLEREREEIQAKIEHVQKQLGRPVGRPAAAPSETPAPAGAPARKKRVLSAAARKRIALAQKRRWAEHRKAEAKSAGTKTAAAGK